MVWGRKKSVTFGEATSDPVAEDDDVAMESLDKTLPNARTDTGGGSARNVGWAVFPSNVEREMFKGKLHTIPTTSQSLIWTAATAYMVLQSNGEFDIRPYEIKLIFTQAAKRGKFHGVLGVLDKNRNIIKAISSQQIGDSHPNAFRALVDHVERQAREILSNPEICVAGPKPTSTNREGENPARRPEIVEHLWRTTGYDRLHHNIARNNNGRSSTVRRPAGRESCAQGRYPTAQARPATPPLPTYPPPETHHLSSNSYFQKQQRESARQGEHIPSPFTTFVEKADNILTIRKRNRDARFQEARLAHPNRFPQYYGDKDDGPPHLHRYPVQNADKIMYHGPDDRITDRVYLKDSNDSRQNVAPEHFNNGRDNRGNRRQFAPQLDHRSSGISGSTLVESRYAVESLGAEFSDGFRQSGYQSMMPGSLHHHRSHANIHPQESRPNLRRIPIHDDFNPHHFQANFHRQHSRADLHHQQSQPNFRFHPHHTQANLHQQQSQANLRRVPTQDDFYPHHSLPGHRAHPSGFGHAQPQLQPFDQRVARLNAAKSMGALQRFNDKQNRSSRGIPFGARAGSPPLSFYLRGNGSNASTNHVIPPQSEGHSSDVGAPDALTSPPLQARYSRCNGDSVKAEHQPVRPQLRHHHSIETVTTASSEVSSPTVIPWVEKSASVASASVSQADFTISNSLRSITPPAPRCMEPEETPASPDYGGLRIRRCVRKASAPAPAENEHMPRLESMRSRHPLSQPEDAMSGVSDGTTKTVVRLPPVN